MKIMPWIVLLVAAGPAFAQQMLHKLDFRDSKLDRKLVDFTLPNAEKYLTPEAEGLRLRFTGKDVPPARQAAGVFWRFDARGDFVVTARYEILKIERPKTGQGVGAGLYIHLKNPEQEAIALARRFQPAGDPYVVFNYMTANEKGGTSPKMFKKYPTGDRSLRGAFRLARQGKLLIASAAEGDGPLAELHSTEVSNANLDLIRFAGFGGGDANAVLDMRILEFHFQGKDLAYYDRDVTPPVPVVEPDAPHGQVVPPGVAPIEAPIAEPVRPRTNLFLLIGGMCSFSVLVLAIGVTVLFLRTRASKVSDSTAR